MPIDKYFKGKGEQVMREMKRRYGQKAGERVFYATANKLGMAASGPRDRAMEVLKAKRVQ